MHMLTHTCSYNHYLYLGVVAHQTDATHDELLIWHNLCECVCAILDFQRAKKKSSECAFAYQSLNFTEKFYFHEMWFDVYGQYGRKLNCVCVFNVSHASSWKCSTKIVCCLFLFFVYVFIYAITNRMEPKLDLKEQVIITTTQHQCKFLFKYTKCSYAFNLNRPSWLWCLKCIEGGILTLKWK